MAKYVIFDGKTDIYTPGGKVYTAEEWTKKYPWSKVAKMVISGGVINGALAFVYDDFVEDMKKRGVDFEGCETDQDFLDRIEEWENEQSKSISQATPVLSAQERIANALADLIMLQSTNEEINNDSTDTETTTETTDNEEEK